MRHARPDVLRGTLTRMILRPLALLLVLGTPACSATKGTAHRSTRPSPPRAAAAAYPGFGFKTTGGAGRPVFTVTTLADSGPGSLRDALAKAGRDGGTITFAVGGGIKLASGLDVPGQTTIDGSSAPPPGITLWGERAGAAGTGVLNIFDGNIIVRGLRIRDGMNDGIQIAPKRRRAVANVVVDHCSITNSADGGIDITGRNGLPVTDVTIISNYLAGNGGPCAKGMCGGGSLAKYGVDRLSYYYNFWDKNLRRTPAVSGDCVADIRYNVIRSPVQGGIQIRDGARANVITFQGTKATIASSVYGGHAHLEDPPSGPRGIGDLTQPVSVPHLPPAKPPATVVSDAGALPRAAADSYYIDVATTLDQVKGKTFGP
jgi:hypothetical protein